jgi:uncharacterized protein YoxC
VSIAHLTALDGLWVALSVFLVVLSLALVYAVVRLASALGRLAASLEALEDDALPVVRKVEGTVERVNQRLDAVDRVTDGAVDAVARLDTAARALTSVVARPAQKVSALATGITHGGAALRARHDAREAYHAGREAAARRELEIEEELER